MIACFSTSHLFSMLVNCSLGEEFRCCSGECACERVVYAVTVLVVGAAGRWDGRRMIDATQQRLVRITITYVSLRTVFVHWSRGLSGDHEQSEHHEQKCASQRRQAGLLAHEHGTTEMHTRSSR